MASCRAALCLCQDLTLKTELEAVNGKKMLALEVFAHALRFFKEHALQVHCSSQPTDGGQGHPIPSVPSLSPNPTLSPDDGWSQATPVPCPVRACPWASQAKIRVLTPATDLPKLSSRKGLKMLQASSPLTVLPYCRS